MSRKSTHRPIAMNAISIANFDPEPQSRRGLKLARVERVWSVESDAAPSNPGHTQLARAEKRHSATHCNSPCPASLRKRPPAPKRRTPRSRSSALLPSIGGDRQPDGRYQKVECTECCVWSDVEDGRWHDADRLLDHETAGQRRLPPAEDH